MPFMNRTLVALALASALAGGGAAHVLAEGPPEAPHTPAEPIYDVDGSLRPSHIACFDANCSNLGERDPFSAWSGTFQVMAGWYQQVRLGPHGPPFDYIPLALRLGSICNTPSLDHCCLRGCVELLLEVNYCPVVKKFGSYVTGPDLIARYNFVQPDWVVVPYIQGGAGLAFTDGWRTPWGIQRLIGQELEFLLRGEAGARVMFTECVSLDAEFGFQHISNANLGRHNGGVNNVGFTVGFTYFFGKWH
jgi:hypothetical protein